MRKTTKILLKVLSALLLLPVVLSLFLTLLLTVPSVQNGVVHFAADFATEKIGARVGIDHISVGMVGRVKIRGFFVEDSEGDTLIYAKVLKVRLGTISDFRGGIRIPQATLENGCCYLRELESGMMNIKDIVSRLSKKKGNGKFSLIISSLKADSLEFRLQNHRQRNQTSGVNYSDMRLCGISTHISDFSVKGSNIGGDIRHLSFTEKSGFRVDDMRAVMNIGSGSICLDDLAIETPDSRLSFDRLDMDGGRWPAFKYFVDSVRMEAKGRGCRVDFNDVAYFAPSLEKWDIVIPDADVEMSGTIADMKASLRAEGFSRGGNIDVTARLKGLPDIRRTRIDAAIRKLHMAPKELLRMAESVARLRVSKEMTARADNVRMIDLSGKFSGLLSDFVANATLGLDGSGGISASCRMQKGTEGTSVEARADVVAVDVGRIIGSNAIGESSFSVSADGVLSKDNTSMSYSGVVHSVVLNEHRYSGVDLSGRYSNRKANVTARIDDSSLQSLVSASYETVGDGRKRVEADVTIERADLRAMNINRRDSISTLAGKIDLSLSGSDIDDASGSVTLDGMSYVCESATVENGSADFRLRNEAGIRLMTLRSPYVDLDIEGTGLLSEAIGYSCNLLRNYLPSAFERGHDTVTYGDGVTMLHLHTKDMNSVLQCISDEIDVANGTIADLRIDPARNIFSLKASSQFIDMKSVLATELAVEASNDSDSLKIDASTADFYMGTMKLSRVGLRCGARGDVADISGEFTDSTTTSGGAIRMRATMSRPEGRRHISIKVLPSGISRQDNTWNLTSEGIEIDSQRIAIRQFNLQNGNQTLYIDGVASRSASDSLKLRMSHFSFAPFTGALKKIGYSVKGRGSGDILVRSALSASQIDAGLRIYEVDINGIKIPDMRLVSKWDFERSRASLHTIAERSGDTIMRGFYSPQKVKYYAETHLDSLKLKLLDPVLTGVVKDTEGEARIDLKLVGERRDAELSGEIVVDSMATTVAYTQCRYSIPKARIEVSNNHLRLPRTPMNDLGSGTGSIEMDLALSHLSNIEYSLSASFRDCKVFSTTIQDNDLFYGDIIASGDVAVGGDKSGTWLGVSATTSAQSHFYMPLSSKSNISTADFIRFATPQLQDTTNYLVRKKMMFERRMRPKRTSSSRMDIILSLNVRDNTEVQLVIDPTVGDILKAKGNGTLSLHINPRENVFEMLGDYTISEGNYLFTLQNILNKRFTINPGSTVQWTGEPLDAMLNIQATYKVRASLQPLLSGTITEDNISSRLVPVYCNLYLKDRLTHPTIDFGIDIPDTDSTTQSAIATVLSTPEDKAKQFVSLLVANTFVSDSQKSSIGGSTVANTGLEILSNQLSNWLSTEDYNVILRYRSKTDQNTSDQMDFGISKGLINNRLLVELEGNYLFDKSQVVNARSNFTGEAYVTWLIDRSGALRLKGFTHTIDRFDENQGLQETGIGVAYREEFDNATDFKNRIKRRFSGKKKRQEMDARMKADTLPATPEKQLKNTDENQISDRQ